MRIEDELIDQVARAAIAAEPSPRLRMAVRARIEQRRISRIWWRAPLFAGLAAAGVAGVVAMFAWRDEPQPAQPLLMGRLKAAPTYNTLVPADPRPPAVTASASIRSPYAGAAFRPKSGPLPRAPLAFDFDEAIEDDPRPTPLAIAPLIVGIGAPMPLSLDALAIEPLSLE